MCAMSKPSSNIQRASCLRRSVEVRRTWIFEVKIFILPIWISVIADKRGE